MGCNYIEMGDGVSAIICGGKSDHECNEDASILILSDGDRIDSTPENEEKYRDKITGGSVACSICGRAAIDNAMYL